jgi:hypothetical protein
MDRKPRIRDYSSAVARRLDHCLPVTPNTTCSILSRVMFPFCVPASRGTVIKSQKCLFLLRTKGLCKVEGVFEVEVEANEFLCERITASTYFLHAYLFY